MSFSTLMNGSAAFEAEQRLADRKRGGERISRGQKKQMVDAHAAAAFLQDFLDGKLRPLKGFR